MLPLPEIDFRRTPVTLILTALAAAIELACQIDPAKREFFQITLRLSMLSYVWSGEYWRPFTTTLLHVNFFHAAFNIYWMLTFGRVLEPLLGSWRYLGLLVVMGSAVSMTAFLVNNFNSPLNGQISGIGLSGIGYGVFGILWIGRRWRPEFYAVCNHETVATFIIWFFLCILMTRAGTMPVDNAGHAAGLVFGVVYGYALFAVRRRLWQILAVAATCAALLAIATCPYHPLYHQYREYQRQLDRVRELKNMLDNFQLPR